MLKTSKKTRGFTLVELMVTLALLAIAATIAVPSFVQFIRNNQVQAKADELNTLLHYARAQAVAKRRTYEVDFSDINNKVTLKQQDQSDIERELEVNLDTAIFRYKGNSTNIVEYHPNGAATAETVISVCYKNDAANGFVIQVRPSGLTQRYARGRKDSNNTLSTCTL